jgi:hypothetical protein
MQSERTADFLQPIKTKSKQMETTILITLFLPDTVFLKSAAIFMNFLE